MTGSGSILVIKSGGNVGIGTTSPYAKLSIHASAGETNATLFSIASSTMSGTSTLFTVLNNGYTGIRTANPVNPFEVWAGDGTYHLFDVTALANLVINPSGLQGGGYITALAKTGSDTIADIYTASNERGGANGGVGFGLGYLFRLESGGGNLTDAGRFKYEWIDATAGAEYSRFTIQTKVNGSLSDSFVIKNDNVGIGTTTPSQLLHLDTGTADTLPIIQLSAQGSFVTKIGRASSFFAAGATGDLGIAAASGKNIYLGELSSNIAKMVITNGGNVGIGTTSPYSLLANTSTNILNESGVGVSAGSVTWLNSAGSGYVMALGNNSATGRGLLVRTTSVGTEPIATFNSNGTDRFSVLGNGNAALFGNLTVSGTGNTTIAGNVGIGITNPAYKLYVNGASYTNGNIYMASSNSIIMGTERISSITAGGVALAFQTNNAERLRIDASGNVGIGTTGPESALDVDGNFTVGNRNSTSYRMVVTENGVNAENLTNALAGDALKGKAMGIMGSGGAYLFGRDVTNDIGFVFGTSASGRTFVESETNHPLTFGQNNQWAWTIDTNKNFVSGTDGTSVYNIITAGKIGIGTTSPYSLLSISNSVSTPVNTPLLTIASTTAGTATSTLMTVLANGNVGIGTANPDSSLSIYRNNSEANISIQATGSNTAGIKLINGLATWEVRNHWGDGSFRILKSGTPEFLTINTSGFFGLGTSTPNSVLSIYQAAADSAISFGDNNTTRFTMGTDYSDGSKFKISSGAALGTNDLITVSDSQISFQVPTTFETAGDVAIANNLTFDNSTASYIKTAAPFYIEAGEVFNSSDLTLRTFNSGNIVLDAGWTGGSIIQASSTAAAGAAEAVGGKSPLWMSSGLVGHWKMDEASWNGTANEVIDSSGNGNNGQAFGAINGPASTTAGKLGNGGSFDGTDDYVNVPGSSSLNSITTGLTIAYWVRPNALVNYTGITKSQSFELEMSSTGKIFCGLRTVNQSWSFCNTQSSDSITVGTWSHVVLTYDGLTYAYYINGKFSGSNSSQYNGNLGSSGLPLTIGWDGQAGVHFINGLIDDVRLYNRALSANEIQKLYNYAPGPVGWWSFEEGDGQVAADRSGNSNNGRLGSGTGVDANDPVWTAGKFGKGLKFDGNNDYVDGGNSPSLVLTKTGSVSMWFKADSAFSGATGKQKFLMDGGPREFYFSGESSRLFYFVSDDSASVFSNATSWDANWHHAEVTSDGTTMKMYIDGVQQIATLNLGATNFFANDGNLRIGSNTGGSATFPGTIDEVRIYNYARTQQQVLEDMASTPEVAGTTGAAAKTAVAYYKFDEGAGGTAGNSGASGAALNGTLNSGGSGTNDTVAKMWDNNGKLGKAMEFDGSNDYVSVPDSDGVNDFDYNQDFSISSWVKIPSTQVNTSGGTGNRIIDKSGASGAYPYTIWVYNQTDPTVSERGKILFARYDGSHNPYIISTIPLNDNVWHHIIVLKNGSKLYLYIDGRLDGTATDTTNTTTTNNSPLAFGKAIGANTAWFTGYIDEAKVYTYALTADDVKAEYNNGGAAMKLGSLGTDATGKPSNSVDRAYCPPGDTTVACGPIGEWNFEESSGQTAKDTSGNGNDLKLGLLATPDSNDPAWSSGKIGKALKFDGIDDYANKVDPGSGWEFSSGGLNPGASDMTISAWINMAANPTDTTQTIARKGGGDSTSPGFWFWYNTVAHDLRLYLSNGVDARLLLDSYDNLGLEGTGWHHVAAALDRSSTVKFYLDGKFVGERDASAFDGDSLSNNSANFMVGYANTAAKIQGSIDQLRIYSYVRTQTQVAWDYNQGAPVAQWKMDECQGGAIHDSSGNNNHGTLSFGGSGQTSFGTCATSTPSGPWYNGRLGKFNTSLKLDGSDDYVNVPHNAMLNPNGADFSISAWVKNGSSLDADTNIYPIISKGVYGVGSNQEVYLMLRGGSYNGVYLRFRNAASGQDLKATTDIHSDLSNNQWHHIAVSIKMGTTSQLYVDGKLVGSLVMSQVINPTESLYIGRYGTYYFPGQIDDVRIYNYALTSQQVKTIMNGGAVRF